MKSEEPPEFKIWTNPWDMDMEELNDAAMTVSAQAAAYRLEASSLKRDFPKHTELLAQADHAEGRADHLLAVLSARTTIETSSALVKETQKLATATIWLTAATIVLAVFAIVTAGIAIWG